MASPSGVGRVGSAEWSGQFASLPGPEKAGQKSFGDVLGQAIQRADATVQDANNAVVDLASGKVASTHEVMIKLEEANLALQWTLQLRNRALEAYQEIMRMPL